MLRRVRGNGDDLSAQSLRQRHILMFGIDDDHAIGGIQYTLRDLGLSGLALT